jgi:hypothetical protein
VGFTIGSRVKLPEKTCEKRRNNNNNNNNNKLLHCSLKHINRLGQPNKLTVSDESGGMWKDPTVRRPGFRSVFEPVTSPVPVKCVTDTITFSV